MGKVTIKIGKRIIEMDNVPKKLAKKKMEEILQHHPHICSTCDAHSCDSYYNIRNQIINRGIEINNRQIICECSCYHKGTRKDHKATQAELETRYGSYFQASVLDEFDVIGDMLATTVTSDSYEDLFARDELESEYGDLLEELEAPVLLLKKRRHS